MSNFDRVRYTNDEVKNKRMTELHKEILTKQKEIQEHNDELETLREKDEPEVYVMVSDDGGGTIKCLGDPQAVESVKQILSEIEGLSYKVQFLVDILDDNILLDKDKKFTFPDGDVWTATTHVRKKK